MAKNTSGLGQKGTFKPAPVAPTRGAGKPTGAAAPSAGGKGFEGTKVAPTKGRSNGPR